MTHGTPPPERTRIHALLAIAGDSVSCLAHTAHQLAAELEAVGRASTHPAPAGTAQPSLGAIAEVEQLRRENAQLRDALTARAAIEQAKGVLMTRHGCDADTAFEMLRDASRSERRKVRQIAESLVREATERRIIVLPTTADPAND
jgi:hypothetical protein